MTPDPWCTAAEHGNQTAYRRGCRCTTARAASAAYRRGLLKDHIMGRPRTVDALGTRRRIQALLAIGWTKEDLASRLGVTPAAVGHYYIRPIVYARTAAAVRRLYDQLSMVPGPSAITRRRSAKAGYVPPLAWDDDSIDDPAALPVGYVIPSRRTIPLDDVEMLALCGETWNSTATRLGSSRNSIERALTRHGRLDVAHRLSANSVNYNAVYEPRNQWTA